MYIKSINYLFPVHGVTSVLYLVVILALGSHLSAQQIPFRDRFDDKQYQDGDPVTWVRNGGQVTAATGDLVLSGAGVPTVYMQNDVADVSIRTQFLVEDGLGMGIGSRYRNLRPGQGYPYYFAYALLDEDGEPVAGITTAGIACCEDIAPPVPLDFDIIGTEAMMQFDTFGDDLSMWVWPVGTDRPIEPTFSATDSQISIPGGINLATAGEDWAQPNPVLNSKATFRWVQAATESIPEPSGRVPSLLGVLGVSLIRRRTR